VAKSGSAAGKGVEGVVGVETREIVVFVIDGGELAPKLSPTVVNQMLFLPFII
jgi:hypothetical protein